MEKDRLKSFELFWAFSSPWIILVLSKFSWRLWNIQSLTLFRKSCYNTNLYSWLNPRFSLHASPSLSLSITLVIFSFAISVYPPLCFCSLWVSQWCIITYMLRCLSQHCLGRGVCSSHTKRSKIFNLWLYVVNFTFMSRDFYFEILNWNYVFLFCCFFLLYLSAKPLPFAAITDIQVIDYENCIGL